MEELCTALGGLEGEGDELGGWLCPPPGGKLFLSRTQGPSHTCSPLLLTLLTLHFPHPTPSAHLGTADAALGEGQCEPHPRAAHSGYVLSAPSGPPSPRPPPGAQTWALGWAAALCKVILRPSDLQVPFSIAMGEPGAPSTRGHPWFPSLAWLHCQGPSSWHKNYQDLQLVLGDSDQIHQVQTRQSLFSRPQEAPALGPATC